MSASGVEDPIHSLRRRAEQAIQASRPKAQIERILEELIDCADEGSKESCFAHRQLAELLLEENPWAAALHLRRVLQVDGDDDIAHALMGLCQALQGNFRVAVSSYRRAVSLCPSNPWYNHNLGHLLDVALDAPEDAIAYLRRAHRAQPLQEEVGASLALCLGRLGHCAEAVALTRALLARHPHHKDLKLLQSWLERGAPREGLGVPKALASIRAPGGAPAMPVASSGLDDVASVVERMLTQRGCPRDVASRAAAVWSDYRAARPDAVTVPDAPMLAALEYAIGRVDGVSLRQRDVALRHGVNAGTLASRFGQLRMTLSVVAGDRRYLPSRVE